MRIFSSPLSPSRWYYAFSDRLVIRIQPRATISSFAVLLAIKNEAFRRRFPCRMNSVTHRLRTAGMSAWHRWGIQHGGRHATLAKLLVGDDFPCRSRAVGRAIQHQGFLNTEKGPVAVGFAFVKTGRRGDYLLIGSKRLSGGQPRTAKKGNNRKMTHHIGYPGTRNYTGTKRVVSYTGTDTTLSQIGPRAIR